MAIDCLSMQSTVFFSAVKIENFIGKILKSLIIMLKTLIVGTRWLTEAVLKSTYNVHVCIESKIRKIV